MYKYFLFTLLFFVSGLYAQLPHIKVLEDSVYRLNNALKYPESHTLLQSFLEQPNRTNEDKYYANLYLSYTRKRLFDYDNVIKYLDVALSYGLETEKKDFFIANIQCQKALVYFDIQKYKQSDSLMQILSKNKYMHLDAEYQSKIMMQEAYILYLDKAYVAAEKKYDQAIILLRGSSPCDLPMIYTKKIELYDAMNDEAKINDAYKKALHYADSCKIVKYTIYAKEVFANALINQNGMEPLMRELDSLHRIYREKDRLKEIEEIERKYEASLKEVALRNKQRQILLLGILAVGLMLGLSVLGYFLWSIRNKNKIISHQNKVNEHLISAISHDIKEPLLGIVLLLKKLKASDQTLQQASENLEQQINSVNHLLNNLISFKRVRMAKPTLELCTVAPVVTQVIKEANQAIEQKNIRIINTISSSKELPITAEKLHVILKNLLNNALKFSHSNTEIHLTDLPDGIALKDFGIGISDDNQKQLLHQTVIPQSGTLNEKGNGMGLYLIGQLLGNSRITIQFASTLGEGTEVRILVKSYVNSGLIN